jgi:hypothetical protein
MRQLAVPLLLGAVTVVGLLAALLGGAAWQPLSWIALGVPLFVIIERLARGIGRR